MLEGRRAAWILEAMPQRQRPGSNLLQSILRLANESGPGMLQPRGPEQPFAFKDLMIHLILQFTLHIAFRGVLHRCTSQEIHR